METNDESKHVAIEALRAVSRVLELCGSFPNCDKSLLRKLLSESDVAIALWGRSPKHLSPMGTVYMLHIKARSYSALQDFHSACIFLSLTVVEAHRVWSTCADQQYRYMDEAMNVQPRRESMAAVICQCMRELSLMWPHTDAEKKVAFATAAVRASRQVGCPVMRATSALALAHANSTTNKRVHEISHLLQEYLATSMDCLTQGLKSEQITAKAAAEAVMCAVVIATRILMKQRQLREASELWLKAIPFIPFLDECSTQFCPLAFLQQAHNCFEASAASSYGSNSSAINVPYNSPALRDALLSSHICSNGQQSSIRSTLLSYQPCEKDFSVVDNPSFSPGVATCCLHVYACTGSSHEAPESHQFLAQRQSFNRSVYMKNVCGDHPLLLLSTLRFHEAKLCHNGIVFRLSRQIQRPSSLTTVSCGTISDICAKVSDAVPCYVFLIHVSTHVNTCARVADWTIR